MIITLLLVGCGQDFVTADDSGSMVSLEYGDFPEATDADPKATTTCYGDNDWTGSGNCGFWGTSSGSWTYTSGTTWGYYYDDVRYTTSNSAYWYYYWQAPVNGTAKFYAWIPSNHATATVTYDYYCATSSGSVSSSSVSVNQNSTSSAYVYLGSKTSKNGYVCGVFVHRTGGGSQAAADGVKITFTY